jgi:PhoPQ-activated pathogenicity-related protein
VWFISVATAGPLDDYVAKKDQSYGWRIIDEKMIAPAVAYKEMILTSQTWRGMEWHHRVHIYYPAKIAGVREAFLFITGGGWNDEEEKTREARLQNERQERKTGGTPAVATNRKPDFEELLCAELVTRTQMPAVVLRNVPRQPIFDGKVEDQIISYTMDEYLQTGDPTWLLLLPMTKSAVRAMDAVQEFAKQEWKSDLTDFVVSGGSKRGWTTWLTAAVDKRVKACAPAVIDVLNFAAQMKHQRETYGGYSEEIEDYTKRNLPEKWETPHGKELLKIVDPYFYLDRVTQPKLLILGTNDPYWTLDALNIYWNDMIGDKYVLYVANKGHAAIDMPRLVANLTSLVLRVAGKVTFPRMTWDLKADAKGLTLKVDADKPAERAWAWITSSPTHDFRKSKWHHEDMTQPDKGYVYELPMPDRGYAAMYGEALFKLEGGRPLYLCTNVKIIGPGPKTPAPPAKISGAEQPK